jgi:gamma-glutamylcyclotransferase (GGCT)/AIG2-like uncharacterized protein YtfP
MDDKNFINNKYIDPNVYEIDEDYLGDLDNFRKYMENKNKTKNTFNITKKNKNLYKEKNEHI